MIDSILWFDLFVGAALLLVAVLYATGYPEPKKKPRKAKRDYKQEWEEL